MSAESAPLSSPSTARTKPKRSVSIPQMAGIVMLVLVAVFLAENTGKVGIRFVGPVVQVPLYLALLVATVLGGLATALLRHRRRK